MLRHSVAAAMRTLVPSLLALALLAPMAAALVTPPPAPSAVVAVGPIHHTYVTQGTCEADARAVLEFDTYYDKATLLSDTPCIPGYYSILTGCTGGAGQRVVCQRDGPVLHVHLYLEPDGAFDFAWVEPSFDERITGQLLRVEA